MEHGQHHQNHHQAHAGYHDGNGEWIDSTNSYGQAQQQQSVNEYPGYSFTRLPVEPMFSMSMHPPRTTHQQLQPLIMPQWPSMLTSQSTYAPQIFPSGPVPVTPISAPSSATSARPASTPRKTLTDADRRRMCLYHEENPTTKQTEIGGECTEIIQLAASEAYLHVIAMFGVERRYQYPASMVERTMN